MDFTGRVFFSFGEKDVFRLYRLLADAGAEGTRIGVEWVGVCVGGVPGGPLVGDPLATAIAEDLRQADPMVHAAYIQLMLAAVHVEGIAIDHPGLVARAIDKAGADSRAILAPGYEATLRDMLEGATSTAADLGVSAVPSLYRHGPVMHVRTTGAVASGSATRRLDLLAAVMDDDGLWELRKP